MAGKCVRRHLVAMSACFCFFLGFLQSVSANEFFKDRAVLDHKHAPSMHELAIPYDGVMMTGLFYSAGGAGPHPTIILLHAFPGFEKNLDMAQALRRQGFNILFFHYRGTWGSGGDFSWNNSLQDVHTSIAYLKQPENAQALKVDTSKIILVGHSWGGMLSIKAGAASADIKCIASIAPEDWTQWLDTEVDRQGMLDYLNGVYSVEGYPAAMALQDLIDERPQWTLANIVKNVGDKKILLVGGEWDEAFNSDTRDKITRVAEEAGAQHVTSFTIENADHSFSAKRIELIERTGNWLTNTCKAHY